MGISVKLKDLIRMDHALQIDKRPDVCPLCHHAMEFVDHDYAYYNAASKLAQLVHHCQKIAARAYFSRIIGIFQAGTFLSL